MLQFLSSNDFLKIILKIRNVIAENKDYLTALDAAIGDADHGINMERGFDSVANQLGVVDVNSSDVGVILMTTSTALLENVGGAAGPLYGMFFMNMANVCSGKNIVDSETLARMFEAGLESLREIGGGTIPNDKTMVDTLFPVVEEMKKAVNLKLELVETLKLASDAAEKGMNSTKDMIAKRGRASYLGERSRGHIDPGAASSYLIIKTIYQYVSGQA